ncbi:MAG: class I SAM-dependent methyltransferase, partial [Clostridiales bacterium]|nr:class I SAM-dependent methyltransferase [Clostridiales bacterium]
MDNQTYQQVNSIAIDKWADDGWEWSIPITHEDYIKAKDGDWSVLLTPSKPVPHKWFEPSLKKGRMDGIKLLGLASGGGQQMPVFSALGADCTVFDNSERQLERDRAVAAREGYDITAVKGDMTKRLPFDDETFDMIFHPVSNCYIEDVYHVWNECFRVLKKGGVLLAGMDNGIMYLFNDDADPFKVVNKLPYNPLKDPELYARCIADSDGSVQFSHTVEEQVGGQLKAGLVLTDLFEDRGTEPLDAYL